jgi:spermidine synthase
MLCIATAGILASKRKPIRIGGLFLILFIAGTAAFTCPSRGFHEGENTLIEMESRYQYLRAVKVSEDPLTVHLCINEGLDSFHSIYVEGSVLTGEQYYDYYSLLPALAGMEAPGPVCIIGLAAGTIARQYVHFFASNPDMKIDGVELDPKTVEIGRRFMDLAYAEDRLTVYGDRDGRMFLTSPGPAYDVIIIDAYAQQIYIPFHMTTRAFFQQVHDRLRRGGIMGMNLSGFSYDDRLLRAIANTAASVFDGVRLARVVGGRNFMLYAVRDGRALDPSRARLPTSQALLDGLLKNISVFGVTRHIAFDPDGMLLTDELAPVEKLCDEDLYDRSLQLMIQAERTE